MVSMGGLCFSDGGMRGCVSDDGDGTQAAIHSKLGCGPRCRAELIFPEGNFKITVLDHMCFFGAIFAAGLLQSIEALGQDKCAPKEVLVGGPLKAACMCSGGTFGW